MFNFGDRVHDKFTDFEGTVVAFTQYFNGCNRVGVQARALHDGTIVAFEWLDDQQIELVESVKTVDSPPPRGGPMQAPTFR